MSSDRDPDVVLIGEMRDLETIEAALTVSRDRALNACDTPYEFCCPDHKPCNRCIPAASAGTDKNSVVICP